MESELVFSNYDKTNGFDLSLVIPTYRNKQLLFSAINSIISLKKEKDICYEVIVVSNNPDDPLDDLVSKYKDVRFNFAVYRNKKNYGQVGNINQGIQLAKGKYVALLHDDDLLLPNYLISVKKYIKSEYDYSCIIASFYMMGEKYSYDYKHHFLSAVTCVRYLYRRKIQKILPKDVIYSFYDVYSAPTCGTLFLKKAIEDFGYFKNEHGAAWDFYNYRMFNKCNEIFLLHKYIGIRRTESGMSNESKVQREFYEDRVSMVKNEIGENSFIKKYNPTFFTKKPFIKYVVFRIRTRLYFYLHNLDSNIGIPKKMFSNYN